MRKIFKFYTGTSLILRIFAGFIIGSLVGIVLWSVSLKTGKPIAVNLASYISPFGTIFVNISEVPV
jgi:Na+/H+-dicarboxylate symporter